MRDCRLLAVCVLAVAGLALPRAQASKFTLFSRAWGNAIVVTDMTQEGRLVASPSPGKPVYYRGVSLGTKLGSIAGDLIPNQKDFDKFVSKVLAKQGYLGAKPGGPHEPSLYIVVQWGYMTPGWNSICAGR